VNGPCFDPVMPGDPAGMPGTSRCSLLPSLHEHYARFIATTKQSAPGRRIGTFGLAVGAACAFSLGIAGQVLTFRTKAWSSFAPPTRRMPLGQSQASPELETIRLGVMTNVLLVPKGLRC
jgi:hypothetical protein